MYVPSVFRWRRRWIRSTGNISHLIIINFEYYAQMYEIYKIITKITNAVFMLFNKFRIVLAILKLLFKTHLNSIVLLAIAIWILNIISFCMYKERHTQPNSRACVHAKFSHSLVLDIFYTVFPYKTSKKYIKTSEWA